MIFLTIEEITTLHEKLIFETGGLNGIRDNRLLESAVFSVIQYYDENELYPSIIEKSARLAFAIIKNHPFFDGNKRIGILTMLMTLNLNSVAICFTQKELVDLGIGIAEGTLDYNKILVWINSHLLKQ